MGDEYSLAWRLTYQPRAAPHLPSYPTMWDTEPAPQMSLPSKPAPPDNAGKIQPQLQYIQY